MATLTASKITESGLTSSPATAAVSGDQFRNTGVEFLRISNFHRTKMYTVKIEVQNSSVVHPQYGPTTKNHIYKTFINMIDHGIKNIPNPNKLDIIDMPLEKEIIPGIVNEDSGSASFKWLFKAL